MTLWGIALARIDFAEHRLPDRLTLPAYPAMVAIIASIYPANLDIAVTTGAIAIALGVALNHVADLGWGDVKLLGILGIAAAGTNTVLEAIALITLVGGVHALIHLVVDGDRTAHIPFGPALLTGFLPVAHRLV